MNTSEALTMLKSKVRYGGSELFEALATLEKDNSIAHIALTISYVKDNDKIIAQKAKSASANILRNSLINDFDSFDDNGRKKLAQVLDSLDSNIASEIAEQIREKGIAGNNLKAVMLLGLLKNSNVSKNFLSVLAQDQNEIMRATAVKAVCSYKDDRDVKNLIVKQLNDEDDRVRANTVEAIEVLGNPQLIFALKRIRYDGNNRVRANVLKAIYNLGDTNIENDLLDMLKSKDLMVCSALWTIGQINLNTPSIVALCSTLTRHGMKSVSNLAKETLKIING